MKEEKEFSVRAGDGKDLLSVFSEMPDALPKRLENICALALAEFGSTVKEVYGQKALLDYERDEDPRKRLHRLPLIALCRAEKEEMGEILTIHLFLSVKKGGKCCFSYTEDLFFDIKKQILLLRQE